MNRNVFSLALLLLIHYLSFKQVEVIGGVSQQPSLPPTGPCSSSTPIVTPRMKTPKFDRGRLRWNRRRRRTSNCSNNSMEGENSSAANIKRASNSSTSSFYEEFSSPLEVNRHLLSFFDSEIIPYNITESIKLKDFDPTGRDNLCGANKTTRHISRSCGWKWSHK